MRLLRKLLTGFIRNGRLRLYDSTGKLHEFGASPGDDAGSAAPVTLRLHDKALHRRIALNPELVAAEAYMAGTLTFEAGSSVYDLLYLFSINRGALGAQASQKWLRRLWKAFRRRQQANHVANAHKQARAHYDLSTELYELFLDEDLNYSCGFYHSPDDTLEQAQHAKLARAVAKLGIEPGMRICEIGGGWGAFAIALGKAGAEVTSLNVSPEQIRIAEKKASEAGVADRVHFVRQDYREFAELAGPTFDRIVSVGMMEHVGIGHLDAYFATIRGLLKPGGYAYVHSIGRMTPPGTTGPFIRKYIFPGGYVPALSEVFAATERQGLWVADMEVLRLHYYYTIRHWRQRFEARRAEAAALYDERFCRMWEFYLAAVELGFLNGSNMVFQLLLSTDRDAVPIVRDFMVSGAGRAANEAPTEQY